MTRETNQFPKQQSLEISTPSRQGKELAKIYATKQKQKSRQRVFLLLKEITEERVWI
jgi:hypothetical protein